MMDNSFEAIMDDPQDPSLLSKIKDLRVLDFNNKATTSTPTPVKRQEVCVYEPNLSLFLCTGDPFVDKCVFEYQSLLFYSHIYAVCMILIQLNGDFCIFQGVEFTRAKDVDLGVPYDYGMECLGVVAISLYWIISYLLKT